MEKRKASENNIKDCCVTLSKCDALINNNTHTTPEPKIEPAKNSRKRAHLNKMTVEDPIETTCSKKPKQGKRGRKPKSPQTKSIEPKIHDLPQTKSIEPKIHDLPQTKIIEPKIHDLPQTKIIEPKIHDFPQTKMIERKLVYGLPQVNTKKRRGRASNFGINFDLLMSSGTLPYLNNDLDNSIKDTTPCVKNVEAPKENVNDSESIPNTTESNTVDVPVPYRSRYRRCTLPKKNDLAKKTTESNKIGEKNVESHDCILDTDHMPKSVETELSSQVLEKSSTTDTLPLKKNSPNIDKKSSKVRTKKRRSNDVNLIANDTQPIRILTRATRKEENSSHPNVKAKLINNKKSTKDIWSVDLNINCGNGNNGAEVVDPLDNPAKETLTCPTEVPEGNVTCLDNNSSTNVDVLNNSKKLKKTLITDARSSKIPKDISFGKSTKLLQRPKVLSKVVKAKDKKSDQIVVMSLKTRNGIKENDINICPEKNLGSSDVEKKTNLKINTECTPKSKNELLHSNPPNATITQSVKNTVSKSDIVPRGSETPRSPTQPDAQQDMSSLVINNQSNEKIVTEKLPIECDIENIVKRYNIPYETVKRVVLDEPLAVFREQYSKDITPAMFTVAPIVVDSKPNQDSYVRYKVEPIRESMAYEKTNIKDMMAELSKTMPSWSLSIVTNPACYVISKMSINDYGVPVVSKAIVLDRNFNGSVYINQTLEYKYCKQYTTPAEIVNLIKQINSL